MSLGPKRRPTALLRTNSCVPTGSIPQTEKVQKVRNDKDYKELTLEDARAFQSPKFIREPHIITFGKNFNREELKLFLSNFHENFLDYTKETIKDKCPSYSLINPDFSPFRIEWITISNTKTKIEYVFIQCKIQLTARAIIEANNSIFIPNTLEKTETAFEIFANSEAYFENCHFYDAERTAVIVRNYSKAVFKDCVFVNNKLSCFIMDDSYAEFINCKFKNDQNISLFISKDGNAKLTNCEFNNIAGKAIFAKESSKVYVTNTKFINCTKGAVTISDLSYLYLDDKITIDNPQNTAIRVIGNSHVKARGLNITNTFGNCINLLNSDGYFFHCNFQKTLHPTIAIVGRKSNPVFYDINISENYEPFCVICKNGPRPLFMNCFFSDCNTNCISVSDFSCPHFQNCTFSKTLTSKYLSILGGSKVTSFGLKHESEGDLKDRISVFPTAEYIELENETAYQNIDPNSEFADEEEEIVVEETARVKSWCSPNYVPPPTIEPSIMADPPELHEIKPLPLLKLSTLCHQVEGKKVEFACSKCHKRIEIDPDDNAKNPFITVPCGHILCPNCEKSVITEKSLSEKKNENEQPTKCFLCSTNIKETKKMLFEENCPICYDNKSDTLALPCGHLCMCYKCAAHCADNNFNCPICNEQMSSYKYMFNDIVPED